MSLLLPQFSRSRLAQWIRDGRVELDGRPALPKTKVWGGEIIALHPVPDPAATAATAEAIALDIVYEDAAVLVIAKPAGLVVHPGRGNWSGTLLNALLAHAPQLSAVPRAGIVHRLDKDTSGLLVVAKSLEAQTSLVRQLQARTVRREYLALVHGRVRRDGTVEAPIGRHPVQRTRMAVAARGRPSTTHYAVLQQFRARDFAALPPRNRPHPPDTRAHAVARPSAGRRLRLWKKTQPRSAARGISPPGAARGTA